MIETDSPHFRSIIVISSSNAVAAAVERGEYCMAKTGLSMLVKLFAVRLAEAGINVYEVRPGLIKTAMTAPVADKYDALLAEGFSPINRWGMPDDVGRAVAMLRARRHEFCHRRGASRRWRIADQPLLTQGFHRIFDEIVFPYLAGLVARHFLDDPNIFGHLWADTVETELLEHVRR